MVTNFSGNPIQMWLMNMLIHSLVIGAIIGVIPAIFGVIKRKKSLAIWGFFSCIIASLIYSWILSIIVCAVFIFLIYKKDNQASSNPSPIRIHNYMKILFAIIPIAIITVIILWFTQTMDGTGDTPEWKRRNLRIWKNTPAWDLALAVKNQNTWKIKSIAKSNPEVLNYKEKRFGLTLLIWSVGVEKYNSTEALLQCGANPNIATPYGETALFEASGYSWIDNQAKKDPKYVKLLLKYGADPNIYYIGGDPNSNVDDITPSPLMKSIGCGIEKTKALVEGGADINKTVKGMTAVIWALWEDGALEYAR